jgi:hypothetical protein
MSAAWRSEQKIVGAKKFLTPESSEPRIIILSPLPIGFPKK